MRGPHTDARVHRPKRGAIPNANCSAKSKYREISSIMQEPAPLCRSFFSCFFFHATPLDSFYCALLFALSDNDIKPRFDLSFFYRVLPAERVPSFHHRSLFLSLPLFFSQFQYLFKRRWCFLPPTGTGSCWQECNNGRELKYR